LRFEIRKKNLKLFSDLISCSPNPGINKIEDLAPLMIKEIEIIEDFLNLAESQEMADSRNFLVLEREYNNIKSFLEKKIQSEDNEKPLKKEKESLILTSRQEKIMSVLKSLKSAQAGEILDYFEGVTKRTLRRDLGRLAEKGLIRRIGKANQIFYEILD
jgi:DNA-binding transcriptional ArsR family regulator